MQRHRYLSSTQSQLYVLHPLLGIMVVRMYQYDQNKIDGLGTWPEFENEMNFYVPVGVILIELEDCSVYATGIESGSPMHGTRFVPNGDAMKNKDYPSVQQYGCFLLATGDLNK
jgi:hypothetical protein